MADNTEIKAPEAAPNGTAPTGPVTITADEHAQSVSLVLRLENLLKAEGHKLEASLVLDGQEAIARLKLLFHHQA